MDILVIDGVVLPTPNEYKVQLSDLDSSGTGRTKMEFWCASGCAAAWRKSASAGPH